MIKLPEHIANPDPSIYLSENYVTLDFETTNLDYGSALNSSNNIVLSVLRQKSVGPKAYRCTWGNELNQGRLLEEIERSDFFVAHNAKFECGWLKRCGADLTKIVVWDTMLAEYIINGNQKVALDLDSVCARYGLPLKGPAVKAMMDNGVCPSEIPDYWLEERCKHDVSVTAELFKRQLVKVKELGLLGVVYTRCLAVPVLADIEFNGMHLDEEAVKAKYNEVLQKVQEQQAILDSFTTGINWNSPDQVAQLLYDELGFAVPLNYKKEPMLTAGGKRSVGKEALASLRATTNLQKEFVTAYKEWNKYNDMMSKYLEKMLECCEKSNGILYANFNQAVARTLRLTSTGHEYKIQFHNFDRTLKPLFNARHKGWSIEEDDGASLEFRVAGHLGRDAAIIDAIRNEFDVHRFTASILNRCNEDEVTGEQRTLAKKDTFKPLYGGQSGTEAQKAYYEAFREKYPGITETQNNWIKTVLHDKQLVTETGLIFYWPDTKLTRTGYITNRESICNYQVQYVATGEIIPITLIHQWHKMKARKLQSFIVNTVHDSIASELKPSEAAVYRADVIESFTTDVYRYLKIVYNIDFLCPLGVGCKIGTHWGKGVETKINVVENTYLGV